MCSRTRSSVNIPSLTILLNYTNLVRTQIIERNCWNHRCTQCQDPESIVHQEQSHKATQNESAPEPEIQILNVPLLTIPLNHMNLVRTQVVQSDR